MDKDLNLLVSQFDDLSPSHCEFFRKQIGPSTRKGTDIARRDLGQYIYFRPLEIDGAGPPYPKDGENHDRAFDKAGLLRFAYLKNITSPGWNIVISLVPQPSWDNRKNGPFGEVVSGLDVLKRIRVGPITGGSGLIWAEDVISDAGYCSE